MGGHRATLQLTYGAMRSSGLETINFKFMTKLNRKQKVQFTTDPAISYSTCYVSVIFLNFCAWAIKLNYKQLKLK